MFRLADYLHALHVRPVHAPGLQHLNTEFSDEIIADEPSEAAKADGAPAGADAASAEKKDFPDAAEKFGDGSAKSFFDGFVASAAADGDGERARALGAAGDALIADARAAGTDAAELASALDIVRERQGDTIAKITPERIEADFAAGMATLQTEFGDSLTSDLAAARAFFRDLDKIAPGTIDSLELSGCSSGGLICSPRSGMLKFVRAAIGRPLSFWAISKIEIVSRRAEYIEVVTRWLENVEVCSAI